MQKSEQQIAGLMVNILGTLQNELAINKVNFIHSVVDVYHNRVIKPLNVGNSRKLRLSGKHRSLYSTYKMLVSLNQVVKSGEYEKFKNATAVCLHLDESTDLKKRKLLLVYLTISGPGSKSDECFGTIIDLADGLDAFSIATKVDAWLQLVGISRKSVVMFTSDGASVMLGHVSGVAKRLRTDFDYSNLLDYHCVCHRENLALKDAFSVHIFYYFFIEYRCKNEYFKAKFDIWSS